jgi:TorA maturation chaperone TorD
MTTETTIPVIDESVNIARTWMYKFLSVSFSDPIGEHFKTARNPALQSIVTDAVKLLTEEARINYQDSPLAEHELPPSELDFSRVVIALEASDQSIIEQHQALFGLVAGKNAPPYETEYCHTPDTTFRSQQLADAAGFYTAFGLQINQNVPERQDHITIQLEFMARLIKLAIDAPSGENATTCIDAQGKFLKHHMVYWMPVFTSRVKNHAKNGLYKALALTLASFIPFERSLFNIDSTQDYAHPLEDEAPEDCMTCPLGTMT